MNTRINEVRDQEICDTSIANEGVTIHASSSYPDEIPEVDQEEQKKQPITTPTTTTTDNTL